VSVTAEALVQLVAGEGLPRGAPIPTVVPDDDLFDELLEGTVRERITGHLDRALHAGWLDATVEQRDRALSRHEEMLSVDLVLERLLVDTSRALTGAGIPHRALKGPVVARTAYADPSLRSFGDVDLLVEGRRFDEAVALLELGGGRARYREPRPHFTSRFGKGVCVVTADGLEIDVHRVFVSGPFGLAIDPRDLFADHDTITIGEAAIPVPGATVRFLHACYHVALTSPRLTAVRDVAQMAFAPDLDVDGALRLASRWRGRAVVQRALLVTQDRLSVVLPRRLGEWAERYTADRFERTAMRPYVSTGHSYAAQMATGLWAVRGVRARAAYGAALLIPDRRYVREREGGYVRRWRRALKLGRRASGNP